MSWNSSVMMIAWIDMALAQVLGGAAISDFQGLRHLAPGDRAGGIDPDGVAGVVGGR